MSVVGLQGSDWGMPGRLLAVTGCPGAGRGMLVLWLVLIDAALCTENTRAR
jgi:hypothetical protein